jgi:hypothetical protein
MVEQHNMTVMPKAVAEKILTSTCEFVVLGHKGTSSRTKKKHPGVGCLQTSHCEERLSV